MCNRSFWWCFCVVTLRFKFCFGCRAFVIQLGQISSFFSSTTCCMLLMADHGVPESMNVFRVKIDFNWMLWVNYTIPFGFNIICNLRTYFSNCWNEVVFLRITDEGSVPEIRLWFILLIKSDLKWCIHLSRSLFYIVKASEQKILVLLFDSWKCLYCKENGMHSNKVSMKYQFCCLFLNFKDNQFLYNFFILLEISKYKKTLFLCAI